jgi:hypothetical protein
VLMRQCEHGSTSVEPRLSVIGVKRLSTEQGTVEECHNGSGAFFILALPSVSHAKIRVSAAFFPHSMAQCCQRTAIYPLGVAYGLGAIDRRADRDHTLRPA